MSAYNTYGAVDSAVQTKSQSQVWPAVCAGAFGFVAVGALMVGLNTAAPTALYAPASTVTRTVQPMMVSALGVQRPSAQAPARAMASVSRPAVWEPVIDQTVQPHFTAAAPQQSFVEGSGMVWAMGTILLSAAAFFMGKRAAPQPIAMMANTAQQPEVDYDALITQMLGVDDSNLKLLVAQSMPVLKAPFFQRVEELAAATADEAEKAKLTALGDRVLAGMKEVVDQAQGKVQAQSAIIQGLIGICCEEDGTFILPLSYDKNKRLREVVRTDLQAMSNDIFINATMAFMAKAGEDKNMDMIAVLQKMLQVYAAESLLIMAPFGGSQGSAPPEAVQLWVSLLTAEVDDWDNILKKAFFAENPQDINAFKEMLDTGVGAVIFENAQGSIQQVLAQFVYQIIDKMDKLGGGDKK